MALINGVTGQMHAAGVLKGTAGRSSHAEVAGKHSIDEDTGVVAALGRPDDISADNIGTSKAIFEDEENNAFSGDAQTDSIFGGAGNDTIRGGDGEDSLFGEEGNDKLFGNAGNVSN